MKTLYNKSYLMETPPVTAGRMVVIRLPGLPQGLQSGVSGQHIV